MFNSQILIYQVDNLDIYLKSLLNNNNYSIFIKLLLKIYNLCQIYKKLICKLLKSIYDLKN